MSVLGATINRVGSVYRSRRFSSTFRIATSTISGASAFAKLHPSSMAVSSVQRHPALPAHLNVVLPQMRPEAIFAGVKTALEVACAVATHESVPLRLISLGNNVRAADRAAMRLYLLKEFHFDSDVSLAGGTQLVDLMVGEDDLWLATHWTTAHSIDVACRLDVIGRSRVIYLVQDYEPGFYPWSTDFALARSTYHAGFVPLVNSTLLASYLEDAESVKVDPESIFGPSVDIARLRAASEARKKSLVPRVFFYGRPSKPRNLFDIGVSALTLVAQELASRGTDGIFVSAGEKHADVDLTSSHKLRSLGKLSWDGYFDLLGASDIVLSLQHSPHPSHPPLDAVCSGAIAVTNELGSARAGLDDRLLVAEPEPKALALEILRAIDRAMAEPLGSFSDEILGGLGGTLNGAVHHVLKQLGGPKKPTQVENSSSNGAEDSRP